MSVSYETFAKTDKETFQNERFLRDIRKNGHRNLPKGAFRARHSQKQTPKSSKRSVSCETFAKTAKETFQNERFVRDIRKNGHRNLPKGAFRARHLQKLPKRPSKMSVSYETFAKTKISAFQCPNGTAQKRRLVHSNAPMAQRVFHTFDTHDLRRGLRTQTA